MRPRSLPAFALAAALALGACGSDTADTGAASVTTASAGAATTSAAPASAAAPITYPFTFENCGRSVTLKQAPKKILSIGTSAVSQLFEAGAAGRVAARAGEFGTPAPGAAGAAVAAAPVLVADDPGTEAIVGSGVDTVIGYGLFATTAEDLAAAGVTAITISSACGDHGGGAGKGERFEAMYADIELYGKLFGTSDKATASIAAIKQRIEAVGKVTADGSTLTAANVYFWGDTPSSRGGTSITTQIFETIGLVNVFADVDASFIENNTEDLVKRNPQVLVINYLVQGESFEDAKARLLALPGISAMEAVRNNRIVGVPSYQMAPDPNGVDGMELLVKALRTS